MVLSQGVGVINKTLNIDGKLTNEEFEFYKLLVIYPDFFSTNYITFARVDIKYQYYGSSLNVTGIIVEEPTLCTAKYSVR